MFRKPITAEPLNEETPLAALSEAITPTPLVYARNHFAIPHLSADTWRLPIGGAVAHPLTLTLAEVQALPSVTQRVVLECAGNGRLAIQPPPPGTPWGWGAVSVIEVTGTPLRHVLAQVGVAETAVEVLFIAADKGQLEPTTPTIAYARSLPIATAMLDEVWLVWALNGEPLPTAHGYPLRLMVAGWYGMAAVKWLSEIQVLEEPFGGFFQRDDYIYRGDDEAAEGEPVRHIRVRSLIASPSDGARVGREPLIVRGAAWSGDGVITRVELSADGGQNWHTAELEPATHPHAAQRWQWVWLPPQAGQYTLWARAWDVSGRTQPTTARWNAQGYGNNGVQSVRVVVNEQ